MSLQKNIIFRLQQISAIVLILFFSPSLTNTAFAIERTCIITPSDGPALNVRDKPNGKVVNRLTWFRLVDIVRTRNDSKGRPWGYAIGNYKGKQRNWGWIFMKETHCFDKPRKKNKKACGWWVFVEVEYENSSPDITFNLRDAKILAREFKGSVHRAKSWVNSEWALNSDYDYSDDYVVTLGPFNSSSKALKIGKSKLDSDAFYTYNPCNDDRYLLIEKG